LLKGRKEIDAKRKRDPSGAATRSRCLGVQKPVPLDSRLAEALNMWHDHTKYRNAEDWVFASPAAHGQRPYWGQCLMRTIIRPTAAKIGITRHIGWHTLRHTYSSLLRANKTDIRVTPKQSQYRSGEPSSVIRLLQPSVLATG
jgi:integrase